MPRSSEDRLNNVESKLTKVIHMLEESLKNQETWVSAAGITPITGWDFKKFDWARKAGVVKFKGKGKQMKYLVQSIPEAYLLPADKRQTNLTA